MCDKCACCHVPDHGACDDFEQGSNGRCVYCDHAVDCHPGSGPVFNVPLGVGVRGASSVAWIASMESVAEPSYTVAQIKVAFWEEFRMSGALDHVSGSWMTFLEELIGEDKVKEAGG